MISEELSCLPLSLNTPKRKSHVSLEWNYDRNIVVLKQTSRSFGRNPSRCFETFCPASFLATAASCVKRGARSLNLPPAIASVPFYFSAEIGLWQVLGSQLVLDKVNANNNVNNCLKDGEGDPTAKIAVTTWAEKLLDGSRQKLVPTWAGQSEN